MRLIVTTLQKTLLNNEVQRAVLPGKNGTFEVLEDHAPYITILVKGPIRYTMDQQEHTFDIDYEIAYVEVRNNRIKVIIPLPATTTKKLWTR